MQLGALCVELALVLVLTGKVNPVSPCGFYHKVNRGESPQNKQIKMKTDQISDLDLKRQLRAQLEVIISLGDAIKELGIVPAGKLYAIVAPLMTLEVFNKAIDRLIGAGVVQRTSDHVLLYVANPTTPQ